MRPLTVSDQLATTLTGDFQLPASVAATESGRDDVAVLTSAFLYVFVFCFLFFGIAKHSWGVFGVISKEMCHRTERQAGKPTFLVISFWQDSNLWPLKENQY